MTDKITDFSSGKKMADKLTHMKALVIKFSDQFTNGPFYEIKQKIDEALKEIVECLGVDRGVFWEMSENFTDMLVSHYYALPEVADVEMINYRDFPWVMEKCCIGNMFAFIPLKIYRQMPPPTENLF